MQTVGPHLSPVRLSSFHLVFCKVSDLLWLISSRIDKQGRFQSVENLLPVVHGGPAKPGAAGRWFTGREEVRSRSGRCRTRWLTSEEGSGGASVLALSQGDGWSPAGRQTLLLSVLKSWYVPPTWLWRETGLLSIPLLSRPGQMVPFLFFF